MQRAIEKQYTQQARAYYENNPDLIRAVRDPGFHSQPPGKPRWTPEDAEAYLKASFQQVKRTLHVSFDIESLSVRGDTALVHIHQHWKREQDVGGKVVLVDTQAHQREWWLKHPDGWKIFFVDDVHPGPWIVDGTRVSTSNPSQPANPPQGLGQAAIDNAAFEWIKRDTANLRLYFLAGSYAAAHQDDLAQRAEAAHRDNLRLLGVERFDDVIDVFFIESRAQMDSLVGVPVTGLADRDARAVFLVTNPGWRSFERHEIMHVLAHHVWGPASGAWVEEGFAQFADRRCGEYTNDDVVHGLAAQGGYVPIDTLVATFRQLDDLTAYLEAASMMGFLFEKHGRDGARAVWQRGLEAIPEVTGEQPSEFAETWWQWVTTKAKSVPKDKLAIIRDKGCG